MHGLQEIWQLTLSLRSRLVCQNWRHSSVLTFRYWLNWTYHIPTRITTRSWYHIRKSVVIYRAVNHCALRCVSWMAVPFLLLLYPACTFDIQSASWIMPDSMDLVGSHGSWDLESSGGSEPRLSSITAGGRVSDARWSVIPSQIQLDPYCCPIFHRRSAAR